MVTMNLFWFLGLFLRPFGLLTGSDDNMFVANKRTCCSSLWAIVKRILLFFLLLGTALNVAYWITIGIFLLNGKDLVDVMVMSDMRPIAKGCFALLNVVIALRSLLMPALQALTISSGKYDKLLLYLNELVRSSLTANGIKKLRAKISWISLFYMLVLLTLTGIFFTYKLLRSWESDQVQAKNEESAGDLIQFVPDINISIPFAAYAALQTQFFYFPFFLSVLLSVFVAVFGLSVNECLATENRFTRQIFKEMFPAPTDAKALKKFEERPEMEVLEGELRKLVEERSKAFLVVDQFKLNFEFLINLGYYLDVTVAGGYLLLLLTDSAEGPENKYIFECRIYGLVLFFLLTIIPYIPLIAAGFTATRFQVILYKFTGRIYAYREGYHGKRIAEIVDDIAEENNYNPIQLVDGNFIFQSVSVLVTILFISLEYLSLPTASCPNATSTLGSAQISIRADSQNMSVSMVRPLTISI